MANYLAAHQSHVEHSELNTYLVSGQHYEGVLHGLSLHGSMQLLAVALDVASPKTKYHQSDDCYLLMQGLQGQLYGWSV